MIMLMLTVPDVPESTLRCELALRLELESALWLGSGVGVRVRVGDGVNARVWSRVSDS